MQRDWNIKKYKRVFEGDELNPEVDRLSTKTGLSEVRFTLFHLNTDRRFDMVLLP
ncbi:MAG: hypothetical protein RIR11_2608 [Bacteroidota bacterium]|jgi:hypothetical protein